MYCRSNPGRWNTTSFCDPDAPSSRWSGARPESACPWHAPVDPVGPVGPVDPLGPVLPVDPPPEDPPPQPTRTASVSAARSPRAFVFRCMDANLAHALPVSQRLQRARPLAPGGTVWEATSEIAE